MAGAETVKTLVKLVALIVFVAGIMLVMVAILQGVGWKSGNALGMTNNASWNASQTMLEDSVTTAGSVFDFAPWLGVLLILMGAFGLSKLL